MDYSHVKLIDNFYPSDNNDKIRVTRDEKTGAVLETMKKIRLGDLNIYSPKNMADWRVSVNLEVPGTVIISSHMVETSNSLVQCPTQSVQLRIQGERTD